jgi:hypothetical protein
MQVSLTDLHRRTAEVVTAVARNRAAVVVKDGRGKVPLCLIMPLPDDEES